MLTAFRPLSYLGFTAWKLLSPEGGTQMADELCKLAGEAF